MFQPLLILIKMKFLTVQTLLHAVELIMFTQVQAATVAAEFTATLPHLDNIQREDPNIYFPEQEIKEKSLTKAPSTDYATTQDEIHDYVVIFDKNSSKDARYHHKEWVSKIISKRSYDNLIKVQRGVKGYFHNDEEDDDSQPRIKGYHGTFSKDEADQIQAAEEVSLVEKDDFDLVQQDYVYVQYNTPWGLGRISHISFNDTQGIDDSTYVFDSQCGANTTLYILDSGIRTDHIEFTGRVRWGANFIDNMENDVQGHGTHVSGIAAGHNVGVAKFANIVPVKVIDSQQRASISNIIKGVQWIISDHANYPGQKAVINYSAVGVISDARAQAMQAAVNAGIMVVTAAGNSNADACNYGPADMASSTDGVVAVAALNYTDTPASFSNYGSCVSVYAPGVSILSASNDSNTAYKYMSGTSMSSPYVAGLAAYFWSIYPSYSISDIRNMIVNYNNGQIQSEMSDTVNKIAYNHL